MGERAFEIALARQVASGEDETAWFARHGSTPITEIPRTGRRTTGSWSSGGSTLIESNPFIRLLEKPEYKRRWATEPWEKQEERALRGWLLDRLEDRGSGSTRRTARRRAASRSWPTRSPATPTSCRVLALWEGRPDVDVTKALTTLLTDEAVPFLAAYRLKDSGLRKREAWEHTWDLQRREDAGEDVGDDPGAAEVHQRRLPQGVLVAAPRQARRAQGAVHPLPGRRPGHRPDAAARLGRLGPRPAGPGPGHHHRTTRVARAGPTSQLVPLVAGLAELQPWVEQWHAELDPTYGMSLADFCSAAAGGPHDPAQVVSTTRCCRPGARPGHPRPSRDHQGGDA